MRTMERLGAQLEVTALLIPGIADDDEELKDAAGLVAGEPGVETPWHISRFFPACEMSDVPLMPVATLCRAGEIGVEAGLRCVYAGNVPERPRACVTRAGKRRCDDPAYGW